MAYNWHKTPAGREARRRYKIKWRATPRGKLKTKERARRHSVSKSIRAWIKKYGDAGVKMRNEHITKRNRSLRWGKMPARRWVREKRKTVKDMYGVSFRDIRLLFRSQGRKCGICEVPLDLHDRHTHIDHDHQTGRVRGILCAGCNIKLDWGDRHKESIQKYLSGR